MVVLWWLNLRGGSYAGHNIGPSVATLRDLIRTRDGELALLHIADHGPLNMRDFTRSLDLYDPAARQVRDKLQELGLIHVHVTTKGSAPTHSITLTPAGQEIVRHLRAIEAVLKKAPR